MVYKTLSSSKVPNPLRQPFIINGYRLLHQPWSYYVNSMFKWHNETINIWSHLLAAIIITVQTLYYGQTYDLLSDPEGNKLLMCSIACTFVTSLSAIAHLFSGRSTTSQLICFQLDYFGIILYAYTTAMGSLYICSPKEVYDVLESVYIPVSVVIATFTFGITTWAQIKIPNPYSWRRKTLTIFPYVIFSAWMSTPLFPRYWMCYHDARCSLTSLNHITLVYLLLIITVTAFAMHLPERCHPGHYDIIGQSHHIFHLCSTLIFVMQFVALKIDIENGISRHSLFNLKTGLLGLLVVLVINSAIIISHVPAINIISKHFEKQLK